LAILTEQIWNCSKFGLTLRIFMVNLGLNHLWIIHPGPHTYPVDEMITVQALRDIASLPAQIS